MVTAGLLTELGGFNNTSLPSPLISSRDFAEPLAHYSPETLTAATVTLWTYFRLSPVRDQFGVKPAAMLVTTELRRTTGKVCRDA